MKKLNNKGFSLVELIIVIAIMVVLIGLLAPQFVKYVEKSRQSTDIQNLDSIVTVLESYQADRTAAEIVVTGATGGNFSATIGGTDVNAILVQYGVNAVKVKGNWGDGGLSCTIAANGAKTYTGSTDYFVPDGSAGYKPKS